MIATGHAPLLCAARADRTNSVQSQDGFREQMQYYQLLTLRSLLARLLQYDWAPLRPLANSYNGAAGRFRITRPIP